MPISNLVRSLALAAFAPLLTPAPPDCTGPPVSRAAGEGDEPAQDDERPPLRTLAAERGLLVGAAVNSRALERDPRYREILAREFNFVTPEYVMKWEPIHPRPDQWHFDEADALVAFAVEHGMQVKGHTLVWHQSLPDYVNPRVPAEQLREMLREHIHTVVGRYRGRVAAWDVVNEAIDDAGRGRRDTVLQQVLGDGYIADAFRWAHEADPEALLFYNDYNCEGLGPKSDRVYELVRGLLEDGVPIHGIGLQMHLQAWNYPDPQDIRANVRRLRELGLIVHVSEMDVRIAELRGTHDQRLAVQRDVYRSVVSACLEEGCNAVTFWGFTDRYSWIDRFFRVDDHPLLFDDHYEAKPAYSGVAHALRSASPAARKVAPPASTGARPRRREGRASLRGGNLP